MKPKTIIPLVIGLGVGFFAIKMGVDMVRKAKGAQGGQVAVYMTAKPIDVATRITESMLATTPLAESLVPSGAFTEKDELVGRVTRMSIPSGVPLTSQMLAPLGSEPGLRAIIPSGHRAVSVKVTEESAVAGFITPGSRVDVSASDERNKRSRLIIQDVQVGAVGQSMSEVGPDGKSTRITKSVTLFLTPEEVQILHAHTGGRNSIKLALRGNTNESNESFWSHLLSAPLTAKPSPSPRVRHVVDVYHGPELERLVFDDRGGVQRFTGNEANKVFGENDAGRTDRSRPATSEVNE